MKELLRSFLVIGALGCGSLHAVAPTDAYWYTSAGRVAIDSAIWKKVCLNYKLSGWYLPDDVASARSYLSPVDPGTLRVLDLVLFRASDASRRVGIVGGMVIRADPGAQIKGLVSVNALDMSTNEIAIVYRDQIEEAFRPTVPLR